MSATMENVSVSVSVSAAIVKAAAAFVVKPTARAKSVNNPAGLVSGKLRLVSSDGLDLIQSVQRPPVSSETASAFFSASRQTHPAGHYGNTDTEAYLEAEAVSGLLKSGFDSVSIGENSVSIGGATLAADTSPEVYLPASPNFGELLGKYRFSAADLFALVSDVGAAADTETSRYALGGLLFDVEAASFESGFKRMHVVASDGKRMHVRTFSDFNPAIAGNESGFSALVPKYALSAIVKAVKSTLPARTRPDGFSVSIEFFKSGAGFGWSCGGWNCYAFCPTMQGRFPRWRDIFNGNKPESVAWFSAYFGELSEAVSAAAAGVCRETKERVYGLDFGHGLPCPSGEERMPRLSAKTPAGEFSAELKYGAVSGGFCVKLDSAFVLDALPKSVFGPGRGRIESSGALVRLETDAADFGQAGRNPFDDPKNSHGRSAVFVKSGGGLEAYNGTGWSAVIMPLAAD